MNTPSQISKAISYPFNKFQFRNYSTKSGDNLPKAIIVYSNAKTDRSQISPEAGISPAKAGQIHS